jgi:diguanylate cyclase (GGDEF)-like protein
MRIPCYCACLLGKLISRVQSNLDSVTMQMMSLHETSPVLVALFDEKDNLRYANPAFRLAYAVPQVPHLSWTDLVRSNFKDGVGTQIQTLDFETWLASASSRRGKQPFRAFETDLTDGRWVWMTETVQANGWLLCIANDISELKTRSRLLRQARDMAQRAAQTDVLTGISNRGHIMEQLEQRLDELRSDQRSCGMVLIDLDNFKKVNDTYGHQGGDEVLRHFARTVQKVLRREDGFGRVGGEEFLLLFPGIGVEALEHVIKRILDKVRASRPLPDAPKFFYTCSAGMCMLQPGDDARSAYGLVDKALYAAKAAGRNGFVWASHERGEPPPAHLSSLSY